MRKGIFKQVLDNGKVTMKRLINDITKLGLEKKKHILESIINTAEEDNENFLHKMRDRMMPFSTIETIGEGVIKNDVDERDDEPFQHVESLHRMPRVAFLLVLLGACATRADRACGLKLDAEREDFLDKVGTRIEVRFENLSVERDAYDGTRALPTLANATLNVRPSAMVLNKFNMFKAGPQRRVACLDCSKQAREIHAPTGRVGELGRGERREKWIML
ncbi:hypothetical protein MTR_8g103430 [Medicago truncatula]|uniref:Uncharacterized protein n=1 Tax=Medicago truncatula TaxID=3880 RepID=G7L896_MEDTR|nr:hypothetical protein MTR_8g103430 [Medicago truncatula]